ncbi:MAG: ABC transporter ATP-binding protein [Deltaproteobacteria bacterium]|nr:ABC transporter ATP-binding protein [Deltaproteobacteria bacterium]MBW2044753.1 ABC transporter ATP-binding protein [Deltaproteobacteria bacterium]MBW2301716.1 ABC transporter ATP-binding protein [Deltaproteobacteria bacterium]
MGSFFQIEEMDVVYRDMQVLWDISLRIEAQEIVSLVGSNGAGKSTIVNAISGLVPLIKGTILLEDEPIDGLKPYQIVEKGVVQVPEGRKLFPTMSVSDTLELAAYKGEAKRRKTQNLERIYNLFPILSARKKQVVGTLSGGEQQMLSIARSLMILPRLLMLDEPSLGLAPLIVEEIFNTIREINEIGTTIFLIEQNVYLSLELSDRGYVLSNGRVILEGPSQELSSNEHVKRAYLGV